MKNNSKLLSLVLRHKPETIGLELDKTQNKIKEIQEDKGFRNWVPDDNKTASDILELKEL
jgi:hypothetical protein